jgi:hypothetical protein
MSNATRLFFELNAQDPPRISRTFHDASSLDVWTIDAHSPRGPTSPNDQGLPSDETAFLDTAHMPWFTWSLLDSIPEGARPKTPPPPGLPCFGRVKIDCTDAVMTVSLPNVQGTPIDSIDLRPEASRACP